MISTIAARLNTSFPGFSLKVDLRLPGHGVTALFGHSGCGKTTLLRCISGLQPADGTLLVGDEVWQDTGFFMPVHQRPLAYVFQEPSLFPHLSVRGNLVYGYDRIPRKQRRVTFDEAVTWLGLDHLIERKPIALSGGQRQRVAIARALLTSPRLLLMDEPLAALDIKSKAEILPYLERLHDELDIPVIYVTHSPDEVARLADHLVMIENGRVLASGSLVETLTRLDLPIRLGEDAGTIVNGVVGEIDQDWHLARVDFQGGSLWTRDQGLPVGFQVRIRILARDISLAEKPSTSSIQNVLPGKVDAIGDDEHPGLALVRVRVGNVMLLARLTRRTIANLDLASGKRILVQIKSVGLVT